MRLGAILTGPHTHLDHLGVFSSLLGVPLVVTDEQHLSLIKQFYPTINADYKSFNELSLEYLATHYDVLLETGKFFAAELKPFLQLLFGKKMRFVYCPHGNSDKGRFLKNHAQQDISLVYGEHLRDLLQKNGAAKKIDHFIRTGNYRYFYYLDHQAFLDSLVQQKVLSRFLKRQEILLYAPSWSDGENLSSFFDRVEQLIAELSSSFNILIKLHPFLFEDYPAHTTQILLKYEDHPSAIFLTDFPLIYPILAQCACYLGDHSSIGYDFLTFDKPLYFFSSHPAPLQSCGLEIPVSRNFCEFILETIEESKTRFAPQRKQVYHYAFGEKIEPMELKKAILEACRL